MLVYRLLRGLLRLAMRVFFRQVEVVGLEHVPAQGPVVFAGNHPNSLIDPILILTTCGRVLHFAAKDTLFGTWIMRALLRALGAVPLARRADHGGGKVDNDAAFTAMFETLAAGATIGIFPEGISHDASQLAKLKTGAARLALGAAARGSPVTVVPCGLTFINPRRFRSRVLIQYGPPITIDAAKVAAYQADPIAAARALTDDLERALRALTINASDWDTVRALDAVRRLYQPLDISIEDRVELARRFNTHYPAVKEHPKVRAVVSHALDYNRRLDELGLADRELARGVGAGGAAWRVGRYLALVCVWMPLMIPGAPLHLPAVGLAQLAGKALTPRKDVIATTKVLTGLLLVLLSYALVTVLVAWQLGALWAVATAAMLPISGYATLKVLDRIHLLRRGLGALWRTLHLRREVDALRVERGALSAEIASVVAEVRPADLELMFPRAAEAP